MAHTAFRWPILLQITLVLGLFAAALVALWHASSSVVGREERRATANDRLTQAGEELVREGRAALRAIRPYPEYMGPEEWAAVARQLDAAASRVRGHLGDVECGYYVPGQQEQAFRPAASGAAQAGNGLYDDIETQADAAYRKKTALSVVEAAPPYTVAIQAIPARSDDRVVGAVWTMVRLDDPIFLDHPAQAYRLFVGFALLGIALSTVLTFNLIATIRRQVAERERLQQHLRRSERLAALGQLLAGVAHEVRNPLAGIRSTAQLWQRGLAIDAESITGLVHEVDRLELIVANLLQFSRADAQPKTTGSLNDVVAEAARLAGPTATAAAIGITTELDAGLPLVEMAAPALLQVFRNLTGNAIQAMPAGGSLRLVTSSDPARRQVKATVLDRGPGLSAEAIEHLFEPFYTTKAEGTGLGLAIAREIALAHGGGLAGGEPPRWSRCDLHPDLAPDLAPGRRSFTMIMPPTVLVADDDKTIRRNLLLFLQSEGYRVLEAADGADAISCIWTKRPDAVLLDLKMPGNDGLEVLSELGPALADLPVIVITAYGGSSAAIEAMRRGAYDFLTKPFDLDVVLLTVRRALKQRALSAEVRDLRSLAGTPESAPAGHEPELIGRSPAMRELFKAIGRVASTEAPVLIVGESGTGKELVATALHRHSERAKGPLIRVNCGALPEGLVESELFGHERGAFTGADRQRLGRFERASGGTIFLDEIGELPLAAQAKLLRVLQQQEFERVGGTETLKADARIVSATHRDLPHEVAAGRFREDLYYRLNVARIIIPPLRERQEDVPLLVEHILQGVEQKHGWRGLSISPDALSDISRRPWPGNIRQLENSLARAAIAARGQVICPEHLDTEEVPDPLMLGADDTTNPLPLRALLAEVERRAIQRALTFCDNNRTRTAERLGISRRQLFDKIREYDLLP